MKRFTVALISFLIPVALFAYTSPGQPTGFVNDFAHILKPNTVASLNAELIDFSQKSTNEISVVTITDLGDETIETYATKLFEEWKIGKEKKDNGVLLLIAPNEREMRIEVGYGLEPVITDIESSHIINDVLKPAFQDGDYDGGIVAAVQRLELDAINEYPVSTEPLKSTENFSALGILSHFTYFIFFLIVALGSVLGRSKSWWMGGVIGAGIGVIVLIFSGVIAAILASVFLIPIGLIFDYIVSKAHENHKNGGPRPPWFLGGGGFGGSGGGGFGGFGGGMSGGGGASGKW